MPFPRSKKVLDPASLYEYAVGALGRRMRTVAELKRLLRQKNVEGDKEAAIEAVILKLKDQKYLNDTRYAEMYSLTRRDSQKLGRGRVITDLRQRGVHGEVIEKAVGSTYSGVDEEKLAREYLAKKRLKKPSSGKRGDLTSIKQSQKETAKIFRTLAHAGFRTGTILKILKKWDVEDEVLTALESETEDSPQRHGDTED